MRVVLLEERLFLNLHLDDPALYLVYLGGHGINLDAKPGRSLVDEVDGLVGQEAVGDVAVRKGRRGHDGAVLDADAVEDLVLFLEAPQDGDSVLHAWLAGEDLLEAAFQGRVLFHVLAELVEGSGADTVELSTGKGRLQQVGRVHGPLGGARAHQGVHLINEKDDVPFGLGDLLDHRLEPLLELAAVLGAGDERTHVQGHDTLVLQGLGHVSGHDALGQALHDGGLAHARFADEHRVVLGPAGQDLDHPPDLVVTADDRVQLPLAGRLGEVAAVFRQRLVFLLRVLVGDPLVTAQILECGKHRIAGNPAVGEDGRHRAPLFLDKAQEQVFGGNEFVVHGLRLALGRIQSMVQRRGEVDLHPGSGRLGKPLQCLLNL